MYNKLKRIFVIIFILTVSINLFGCGLNPPSIYKIREGFWNSKVVKIKKSIFEAYNIIASNSIRCFQKREIIDQFVPGLNYVVSFPSPQATRVTARLFSDNNSANIVVKYDYDYVVLLIDLNEDFNGVTSVTIFDSSVDNLDKSVRVISNWFEGSKSCT